MSMVGSVSSQPQSPVQQAPPAAEPTDHDQRPRQVQARRRRAPAPHAHEYSCTTPSDSAELPADTAALDSQAPPGCDRLAFAKRDRGKAGLCPWPCFRHAMAVVARASATAAWQGSITGTPTACLDRGAMVRHAGAAEDDRSGARGDAGPGRLDQSGARRFAAPAAFPSRRSAPLRAARRDSSPMARRAARWRAFDASTMAMTPNRSACATAAATAARKTPSTGRGVAARAASIPGSEAQAMT